MMSSGLVSTTFMEDHSEQELRGLREFLGFPVPLNPKDILIVMVRRATATEVSTRGVVG